MSTSSTPNCGNLAFPAPCPLPTLPPLDGRGGYCYNTLFPVPTCDIWNGSRSNPDTPGSRTNPSQLNPAQLNWYQLDLFYSTNAFVAMIQGLTFGMMIVTLLNIIVLTPARKRAFTVYWAILGGVVGQIVRGGIAVYLDIYGAPVSAYLLLARKWNGTEWSGLWKALVTTQQVVGCLVVAAVHVAFWCQCRGLLVWVRIRYGRVLYRIVLGILCGLAGICWGWRVVFAVYQIYHFGFAQTGAWWPDLWEGFWWNFLSSISLISAGISFSCWSLVFVISAGWMLWDRRKVILSGDFGGGGEDKVKWRFRSVCERALNLIGFVGVKSFLVPFVLSILAAVTRTQATETLLVPVILASLPLSSLLINGDDGRDQSSRPTPDVQLHIVNKPNVAENMGVHLGSRFNAAKHDKIFPDQSSRSAGLSADTSIDRELLEIDDMR